MDVVVISQSERLPSGALSLSLFLSPTRLELVLCRFLKIRNHEPRFLLLFSERRNCESKNDSFLIQFTILLANIFGIDSRKKAKVKELELRFIWNRNRHSPSWNWKGIGFAHLGPLPASSLSLSFSDPEGSTIRERRKYTYISKVKSNVWNNRYFGGAFNFFTTNVNFKKLGFFPNGVFVLPPFQVRTLCVKTRGPLLFGSLTF